MKQIQFNLMKNAGSSILSLKLIPLLFFSLQLAATEELNRDESSSANDVQKEAALDEYENIMENLRFQIDQAARNNTNLSPTLVQQYDSCQPLGGGWVPRCPGEVTPFESLNEYEATIKDKFYGYQAFILIDKSVSSVASRQRNPGHRKAQTMYVFKRNGQQVQLEATYAISTGREPRRNVSDTPEGFMRVQWENRNYRSVKYGEQMAFSLWIESEYGIAIHQTTSDRCSKLIGTRASAGCIRLCEGDAQSVFQFATSYGRQTPIVLLDKRTGSPIQLGTDSPIYNPGAQLQDPPKVIRGYPVFVRVIDATRDQNKLAEIENLLRNPTQGFGQYFRPVSPQVMQRLGI